MVVQRDTYRIRHPRHTYHGGCVHTNALLLSAGTRRTNQTRLNREHRPDSGHPPLLARSKSRQTNGGYPMKEAMRSFWMKYTPEVLSVTFLWGMLTVLPYALYWIVLNKFGHDLGAKLDPMIGEAHAYLVITSITQLGLAGSAVLFFPAALRLYPLKWEYVFTTASFFFTIAFLVGLKFLYETVKALYWKGVGSESNPLFSALFFVWTLAACTTFLVINKQKRKDLLLHTE